MGVWGPLRAGSCHRTWGNRQHGWCSRNPWDPQCGCRKSVEPPPWPLADFGLQPATPPHGDHRHTPLRSETVTHSAQRSPYPCAQYLKGQLWHICHMKRIDLLCNSRLLITYCGISYKNKTRFWLYARCVWWSLPTVTGTLRSSTKTSSPSPLSTRLHSIWK